MRLKEKSKFGIVIHGGAGGILRKNYSSEQEAAFLEVLEEAMQTGYNILEKGGSSLDAATFAVKYLEDSPLYNAGLGSVMNACGEHELDASIMDGMSGKSGGVGIAKTIKNPILAARKVMENSPHTLLAACGADDFAKNSGLEAVDNTYFATEKRQQEYLKAKTKGEIVLDHGGDDTDGSMGTVGAVAVDQFSNVAAATSTGGLTNKSLGRIGDSAVIGAGTYANNETAALSCTGTGDVFLALSAAKSISDFMQYDDLSLEKAIERMLSQISEQGGCGGIIGITQDADIVKSFTTAGMFRGHFLSCGSKEISMYGDEA